MRRIQTGAIHLATEADLLAAFEVHSPDGIKIILDAGISRLKLIKGKRPIDCQIEGYLRSSRFADCIRVMLAAGAGEQNCLRRYAER